MTGRRAWRKLLTIALCACFVAAVLLASMLAVTCCRDHRHLFDERCVICARIQSARALWKTFGFSWARLGSAFIAALAVMSMVRGMPLWARAGNPVENKVRMND